MIMKFPERMSSVICRQSVWFRSICTCRTLKPRSALKQTLHDAHALELMSSTWFKPWLQNRPNWGEIKVCSSWHFKDVSVFLPLTASGDHLYYLGLGLFFHLQSQQSKVFKFCSGSASIATIFSDSDLPILRTHVIIYTGPIWII